MLISWEALANGKSSWNVTLERPDLPLPVVDITGEVIASNGYKILGFMPDGKLLGKPIPLHPVHGHVMDLSVSSNEYIIILYKCGFLAVYLTSEYLILTAYMFHMDAQLLLGCITRWPIA